MPEKSGSDLVSGNQNYIPIFAHLRSVDFDLVYWRSNSSVLNI